MNCSHACARFSLALTLLGALSAHADEPRPDGGVTRSKHASTADAAVALDAARAQASAPDSVDVATLLSAFSRMPGLEASFSEEKHIALLAKPLVSRGKLFFTHPGLLLRRIESPELSEVVISQDSLRVRDKAGEQTLDLRARKDIRPFVESLTWILAGDRVALEKVYAIDFKPEQAGAPWQLSLKPKVLPLSHLIARLLISGHGMYVEQIEVQETGGDKTVTRILSANPKRSFSAAERSKLFGQGPADKAARPTP